MGAAAIAPQAASLLSSLLGGLLAGHDARIAAAKNENQALNTLVPVVAKNLRDLFAALNAGAITEQDALSYLTQIEDAYWQNISQYQQATTGCSANGGTGNNEPSGYMTKCDKHCTAGCCVGCNNIHGWMVNAAAVFQNGGGTATFHMIPGCSTCNGGAGYGFNPTSDFSLTYTPRPPASQISNAINGLLGSSGTTSPQGLSTISPLLLPLLAVGFLALVFAARD